VIVTLDADFHALLALSGATSPSVIRIRIEGLQDEALAALVRRVIAQTVDALARGTAITVTLHAIRLRALPMTCAET
jgi:predicted nuclease of predicted toxin-antitoxin system